MIGFGSALFVICSLCTRERPSEKIRHTLTYYDSDSSINAIRKFVAERDWSQFHTPGNLAKSISIEAAELLECFQWNDEPQDSNIEHIHEEIADVLIYCIMLSDKFGFDLDEIILDKLAKNAQRYPAEFAYGNSNKAN